MLKVFLSALWEGKKTFRRKVAVVTYQKRFAEYIYKKYIYSKQDFSAKKLLVEKFSIDLSSLCTLCMCFIRNSTCRSFNSTNTISLKLLRKFVEQY